MFRFICVLFLYSMYCFAGAPTELSVAMSDVKPYSYSENGQYKGINYAVWEQIEKKSGLKFNYQLYPHARLQGMLKAENPDLVILFELTCSENNDNYEIQKELYSVKPTLFFKKGVDPKSKNIHVGRIRGTCQDLMKANIAADQVVELTDLDQVLSMLELGRIDGLCALDALMDYTVKRRTSFKEKLFVYKTQSKLKDFEAVICRKKSLSKNIKRKLEKAAQNIKIN